MTSRSDPRRRPDHPSTVVELCGLPGVGKTIVADHLVAALAEVGIVARRDDRGVGPDVGAGLRLGRKARLIASTAVVQPATSARAVLRIAAGQHGGRDAVARPVQWLVNQGVLARARRGTGVHMLEEGLVQALWSAGLRGEVERLLGVLDTSASWDEPDVVLAVEAPLDTVRRRIEARSSVHSRTQRLPEAELLRELQRGDELLRDLLEWWQRRRGSDALLRLFNPAEEQPDVRPIALRIAFRIASKDRT
jgi:AAA domain-containing protein